MTKQEEIRLQAYRLFCQHCQALQKVMGWKGKPCWVTQYNEPEAVCASAIDAIDGLFNYQSEKGVVLKVKCPECAWGQFQDGESAGMTPCFNCNSTGYITEPLIST